MPLVFQINLEPGLYTGIFLISTVPGRAVMGPFRGKSRTFLPEGRYALGFSHGTNIGFTVSAAGLVQMENLGATVENVREDLKHATITLDTTKVHIDAGHYLGIYHIVGVKDEPEPGNRDFVVTKGMAHGPFADVGFILQIAPGNALRFGTTAEGDVVVNAHNGEAARQDCEDKKTLCLNTCTIRIEPPDDKIRWLVRGVEAAAAAGARDVVLLPDLDGYSMATGPGTDGRFNVGADGAPWPAQLVVKGKECDPEYRFRLSRAENSP